MKNIIIWAIIGILGFSYILWTEHRDAKLRAIDYQMCVESISNNCVK